MLIIPSCLRSARSRTVVHGRLWSEWPTGVNRSPSLTMNAPRAAALQQCSIFYSGDSDRCVFRWPSVGRQSIICSRCVCFVVVVLLLFCACAPCLWFIFIYIFFYFTSYLPHYRVRVFRAPRCHAYHARVITAVH